MPRLASLLIALAPAVLLAGETLDTAPDLYAPREVAASDPAKAAELLDQAMRAAEAGEVSVALQLATRALRFDPNEATCRRVLGYQRVDGRWLTSFQAKQIDRGFVWDARFGWIKTDDLLRYEAGDRRDGRRWVSIEKDAQRHAVIEEGWRVRTDHFQVTTNHSLEAAARIGAELEQLFQIWRQLFAGYYLGEAEVRARFAGTRTARSRSRPFNVFYHRTREGYIAHLRQKQSRIEITEGIYFDDAREAHVYSKAESGKGTAEKGTASSGTFALSPAAVHEAVHQLFQESKRARRGVGAKGGFWAVEGVATYFESLTPTGDGRFEIGGPNAGRLPYARHRLVNEGYLVPFDEMASLGIDDLRRRPDLSRLYGQTAAVATFLMHANAPPEQAAEPASQQATGQAAGHRREAFVRYLVDLYAGRAREGSLSRALGEPLGKVQRSYQRWMAAGLAPSADAPPATR